MNQSLTAQAARLEMKRRALEDMERTMTADAPASDVLKYEKLAREFVVLERRLLERPRSHVADRSCMKQLEIEKIAGKRAKWIVTYKRNGRLYFDGLFDAHGDTADEARETFLKAATMMKWRVKEVEVQPRDAQAALSPLKSGGTDDHSVRDPQARS